MDRLAAYRRPLAALIAAAGTGFALLALRPTPAPPGEKILVASRDLPAGATLHPSDLRIIRVPPAALPSGAIRGPTGSGVLAGPMRRGELLTDVRLISSGLLRAYGPDTVAAPVRIADEGAVRLVRQGDRVDILTTNSDDTPTRGARLVVTSIPVITVPRQQTDDQGALVLLATSRTQATALAAAGPGLALTIVRTG